jgi:hypothetical protein
MEGLPRAFFELADVDGRTAARWRRVCKAWRHHVDRVRALADAIAHRLVRLEDVSELAVEMGLRTLPIPMRRAARLFTTILDRQHRFNAYMLDCAYRETFVSPLHFFRPLGFVGLNIHMEDMDTGDLVLIHYRSWPEQTFMHIAWLEHTAFPGTLTMKTLVLPDGTIIDGYCACFCDVIRVKNHHPDVSSSDMMTQNTELRKRSRKITQHKTPLEEAVNKRMIALQPSCTVYSYY